MQKSWLKHYPNGVPAEINPDAYSSLVEIFAQSCAQFSSLPAFYNLGVTLTYQQWDEYSRDFAAYLQNNLKLNKGERVGLMLPNILQYPVAMLGILRAGLIVVNINPLYRVPELIHQVNDAGVETIVVLANFAHTVEEALPHTSLKNIIVTQLGDFFPLVKAWSIYFFLKYIKRKIPAFSIPKKISFKQMLGEGKNLPFQPIALTQEDIAFLQYTGGTTGVAKGAMLTHRNMVANVLQAEAWFSPIFSEDKEIIITALPLYHIFSLLANCLFLSKIGGLNVLITDPHCISQLIMEVSQFKFTAITGVNTLFNALLKKSAFARLDFSHLHLSLGGGAPVQSTVAEKWQAVTGVTLLEAYGLTETSPAVAVNPVNLKIYNGSVGLPLPSTEICILDNAGKEVSFNQPGELAIKGPQVMKGYWRNPEETAKVFTPEGWLLTGDIASVDEQGFVRILERKKDMILVSGFNVYPSEIENVLVQIPGVVEAAVVGVANENSGEAVKAFIVRENHDLGVKDILDFCHSHLTGYKVPKYVEFCEALPKTNVGKILRRELR